jgi:hypothetical protein
MTPVYQLHPFLAILWVQKTRKPKRFGMEGERRLDLRGVIRAGRIASDR